MADENFQIGITTTADTAGAKQAADAIKGLTDETKRYQEALRGMALATKLEENSLKTVADESARYQETLKAMAETQEAEAAGRKQQLDLKKLQIQADRDVAAGVKVVTAEEIQAASAIKTGANSSVLSKEALKAATKGVASEFPGLAHAVRLALNPITGTVAAIVGAFKLWQFRVNELTTSLSQLELPDLAQRTPAINEATKAWADFARSVEKAAEAYQSAEAESNRVTESLKQQSAQQKELLQAEKALELVRLEARKDSLSAGQYTAARNEIEDRFSKAALAIDRRSGQDQIGEMYRRQRNLTTQAQRKLEEAAGIRIGSPEQDAETKADLEAEAQKAREEIKSRRERLGQIAEWENRPWWRGAVDDFRFRARYGYGTTYDQAREIERSGISSSQSVVQRYEAFLRNMPQRDALRSRRSELMGGAAEDMSRAVELGLSIPDAERRNASSIATASSIAQTERMARAYNTAAAGAKDIGQLATEIDQSIRSSQQVSVAVLQKMRELTQFQNGIVREIRSMEAGRQVGAGRTP